MGKQKRVVAYTGHLLKPYFRYIASAEVFTSPIDINGNSFAKKIFEEFKHWDPILAQPQVQVALKEAPTAANAYLKVTYSR